MWLQIKRTFRAGINNLKRNIWLALATIGVIAVTLFIVNIQVANVGANYLLLNDVKDKINISVYLKQDVGEDEGEKIKQAIESYPEVEKVVYVSKEESLKRFKEDIKGNKVLQEAIEEVGENPLGITLNVKAASPDKYEEISYKIKNSDFKDKLESVNYEEYEGVIKGLNKEIIASKKMALTLGVTLSVIAVLITFNTIRITIYTHKKEIEIMKLVGGSNWYVIMPFFWEGIFYGVIAAIVASLISYTYLYYVVSSGDSGTLLSLSNAKFVRRFLDIYLMNNLIIIVIGQLVAGVALGTVSALISIRKYLKV